MDHTKENQLRASLARIRETLEARNAALRCVDEAASLNLEKFEEKPGQYAAAFWEQVESCDRALRVELNFASAVLEGDAAMAETARVVFDTVQEKAAAGLTRLENDVRDAAEGVED